MVINAIVSQDMVEKIVMKKLMSVLINHVKMEVHVQIYVMTINALVFQDMKVKTVRLIQMIVARIHVFMVTAQIKSMATSVLVKLDMKERIVTKILMIA